MLLADLDGRAVLWPQKIDCLASFIEMITGLLRSDEPCWFRGQQNIAWSLIPSALRNHDLDILKKSMLLFLDFQRIAEAKLARPPAQEDLLKWLQLAQHHKVPTCLLDWTESPLAALYFACLGTSDKDAAGAVYLVRPTELRDCSIEEANRRIADDLIQIQKYSSKGKGGMNKAGKRARDQIAAIRPVWNSERLVAQRGTFTLHSVHCRELRAPKAKSLQVIPIQPEYKELILKELHALAVDEFSLFPELDRMTTYLKRTREL